MDLAVIAGYFACAFVGIVLGALMRGRKRSDGILKVDVSDPQRDRYLLEFHIPIEDIPMKKSVILKVVNTVDSKNFSGM